MKNTYRVHLVTKTARGFRDSLLTVVSDGTLCEVVASLAADNPSAFFIDPITNAPFCFRTAVRFIYSNGFTFWSDQETATLEQTEKQLNELCEDYAEHRETRAVLLTSFSGRVGDFLHLCGITDKKAAGFAAGSLFNLKG